MARSHSMDDAPPHTPEVAAGGSVAAPGPASAPPPHQNASSSGGGSSLPESPPRNSSRSRLDASVYGRALVSPAGSYVGSVALSDFEDDDDGMRGEDESGYLSSPSSRPPTPPPSYYCFVRNSGLASKREGGEDGKKEADGRGLKGGGDGVGGYVATVEGAQDTRLPRPVSAGEVVLPPTIVRQAHLQGPEAVEPQADTSGTSGKEGMMDLSEVEAQHRNGVEGDGGGRGSERAGEGLTEEEKGEENEDKGEGNDDMEEMVLRVGRGGRIGTLHVRFIGKELHVTVEDADLVIEAVSETTTGSAPKSDGAVSSDSKHGMNGKNKSGEISAPIQNDTLSETKEKEGAGEGDEPGSKTDLPADDMDLKGPSEGDGMSPLARSLASVPNLFLRDCRVRVVVDGVTEDDDDSVSGRDSATVFLLGVDFLSVTSGEDFLAHLRQDTSKEDEGENECSSAQTSGKAKANPLPPKAPSRVTLNGSEAPAQSEIGEGGNVMIKRIRTGKGPRGGIYFQIFGESTRQLGQIMSSVRDGCKSDKTETSRWALSSYMDSSNMYFFRCSGFDLIAQIALGKKKETPTVAQQAAWPEEYDDYTIDSMLFGVDYVGGTVPIVSEKKPMSQSVDYDVKNDMETIDIKSNYDRIARGMRRLGCPKSHPTSEDCPSCWSVRAQPSFVRKTSFELPIDSTMPLPGLTLYLAVADPLEINVDRHSLDALCLLKSLFSSSQKPKNSGETTSGAQGRKHSGSEHEEKCAPSAVQETSDCLLSSGQQHVGKEEAPKEANRPPTNSSAARSFPSFMEPKTVQITGVHLAKVVMHFHIMRKDKELERGLSFCYWKTVIHSVAIDMHQLQAPELSFRDTRMELGTLCLSEFKGTCEKQLLCMGTKPPFKNSNSIPTFDSGFRCSASKILDVTPPLEMLPFHSYGGHAIRLRCICVPRPKTKHLSVATVPGTSCVDVKFGITDATLPTGFFGELSTARKEAMESLVNKSNLSDNPNDQDEEVKENPGAEHNVMEYSVQFDGGKFDMYSRYRWTFPSTKFNGQRSSQEGLSIETVLNHVRCNYGTPHSYQEDRNKIPLTLMATLPESLRLNIFLFLDDLSPLELALGMFDTMKGNVFQRCLSIDGKIKEFATHDRSENCPLVLPKRVHGGMKTKRHRTKAGSRGVSSKSKKKGTRKQQLIAKLSKLDEHTLEAMLLKHEETSSLISSMKKHKV